MSEETKKFIESINLEGFKFNAEGFGKPELKVLQLAKLQLWDGVESLGRKSTCTCFAVDFVGRHSAAGDKITDSISDSLRIMGCNTVRRLLEKRTDARMPDRICQDYRHHLLDQMIADTRANIKGAA